MEQQRRPWWPVLVSSLALLLGLIGGAVAGGAIALLVAGRVAERASSAPPAVVAVPSATEKSPQAQSDVRLRLLEQSALIEATKKVSPAVVTIINTISARQGRFGQQLAETSLGSGVIVDPRGFILTNEHVIRGTRDLSVVLATGEQYPAKVIGTDVPFSDLALVKIEATDLPTAELGDSDSLELGQQVIAIGSALGDFRNSVTMGIISGLHRSWQRGDRDLVMEDLIQTDAAINHGNSGGALVNSLGQVIGINTSVIRSTQSGEVVEGIGFAIPSNTVQPVLEQLIARGKVARPYMGLVHQAITPALASFYGLPVDHGAYVLSVSPNSPAAVAGLQDGDIVTQIGDLSIDIDHPFLNTLMRFQPGQAVPLIYFRDGKELKTTVTFTER